MDHQPIEMLDATALAWASIGLVGWLVAYVVIIRRGLIDRSYGMPLVPLCINIAWEFVFGVLHADQPPMNLVNIAWLAADLGILWTYWRHGRAEFPALLPRWSFVPVYLAVQVLALWGVLAITYQFRDWTGSYTGWGENLVIPAALIAMLLRRGDTRGQSIYVALATLVGSFALVPLEWRITGAGPLMLFLYAGFIGLGLIYAVLLHARFRAEGKNPWTCF
ncbi:MAG: hypothetical protein HY020_03655 [Burkholderiales bacterium]|nr:hypothetical protein [Burkholderiales bacterium]